MAENHLKYYSSNRKRKILVIEDEMINRTLLEMMLKDQYDVVFAEDGAQALQALDTDAESLSLVLLDLNLPDMKGLDILRKIKADARTAMLPVIVMTADSEAEVACLSLGATDFIPKPYPKREVVLARILRTIELSEDRDLIRSTEKDHLTGLFNREFFFRYAKEFDSFHTDAATDAIVVDINHFHMLNERYGRDFGDRVLKGIAEKLQEAVDRYEGIACRREADTFLAYCVHNTDYTDMVQQLSSSMGEEYQVRIRMGVYFETDHDIEMERRFDRAAQAADAVKSHFAGAVGLYDNSLYEKEIFAEKLLENFHEGIAEKQFKVHYQPKFDVRPKEPRLSSAEALVRWEHPELGMISPGVFIPLFEENGLIRELDSYVWKETAAQIARWKERLGHTIPVSINVSRIDLDDPNLPDVLSEVVADAGLSRSELILEITESAYTEDSGQIIERVKTLRERGFMIEMDDFGSGYSSLNMISALPIDALKLDMQFIRTAFKERKDTRLLEAVIGLAQSLEFPTIAEGVETAEQMFTLKAMGCDIIQGYYFSRPLPADEFEEYVRDLEHDENQTVKAVKKATEAGPKDQFTYDALHDSLTGLYNYSAFDILFHNSDKDHIAVMIATVDDYKKLFATQGRDYADRVIRRVAEVLRSSFRSSDNICRLQEDEFVIIMSRMTKALQDQAFEKIEQINEILQEPQGDLPPIALSVGIAFSDREDPHGDVFEDADTALQRMKQMRQIGCAVY